MVPSATDAWTMSTTETIAFLASLLDMVALAISHKSEDRIMIDAIREARPPLSPDAVVGDFAALLKSYRVSRVTATDAPASFRASCSASMASPMTWPSRPKVSCSAIFCRF